MLFRKRSEEDRQVRSLLIINIYLSPFTHQLRKCYNVVRFSIYLGTPSFLQKRRRCDSLQTLVGGRARRLFVVESGCQWPQTRHPQYINQPIKGWRHLTGQRRDLVRRIACCSRTSCLPCPFVFHIKFLQEYRTYCHHVICTTFTRHM